MKKFEFGQVTIGSMRAIFRNYSDKNHPGDLRNPTQYGEMLAELSADGWAIAGVAVNPTNHDHTTVIMLQREVWADDMGSMIRGAAESYARSLRGDTGGKQE